MVRSKEFETCALRRSRARAARMNATSPGSRRPRSPASSPSWVRRTPPPAIGRPCRLWRRASSLQHLEPTRHGQTSRNASNLLKTKGGAPVYPRRIRTTARSPWPLEFSPALRGNAQVTRPIRGWIRAAGRGGRRGCIGHLHFDRDNRIVPNDFEDRLRVQGIAFASRSQGGAIGRGAAAAALLCSAEGHGAADLTQHARPTTIVFSSFRGRVSCRQDRESFSRNCESMARKRAMRRQAQR